MKKLIIVAGAAVAASGAYAQVTPFTIEASYFRSNNFTTNTNTRSHLEGINLGVSTSILSLPFVGEARIGVSAMFGGFLSTGGVDGNIYGIQALYKTPSALTGGLYGLVGVGFWSAQGRNNTFGTASGFGFELGVGIPISTPIPGVPSPAIEIKYQHGAHAQTRGFMIGLAVRF